MKSSRKDITKSGFAVPKDYLDTLGESLYNMVCDANEFETIETTTTGFSVPENYFENLSDVIINRAEHKKNKNTLFHLTKTQVAVIGSIAALFILVLTLFTTPSKTFTINDLTIADIESYFGEEPIDYENYQSYLYSTTEELTNMMSFSSIQEQSIENYLLLEDIQVELLIQQ